MTVPSDEKVDLEKVCRDQTERRPAGERRLSERSELDSRFPAYMLGNI